MACNGYTRGSSSQMSNLGACPQTNGTYAQCGTGSAGDGAGAPCQAMYATAIRERADMTGLNDRLAGFLNNLKGLQQQPQVDPAKYREAMAVLENEMMNLKGGYEAELDRLRKNLEDCCRDKNNLALNVNSYGTNLSDLQATVQNLQAQLQAALADKQALCGQLAGKDKEIADLRCCLKQFQDELGVIKPDYDRLRKETADCKARLDCELKAKADDGCRLKQMLEKCQFDNNNKDQQIADLTNRLASKDGIIASLEAKLHQLSSNDGTRIDGLLQKMRQDTMNEMKRQQQTSEDALNKALQSLKCQIDTDAQDKAGLAGERQRLQDLISQLQAKISDLEGRLTAVCTENQALKADLARERSCCQQQVTALEAKLRELHEQMMGKIKECNQARDQQVCLNTEISNYKSLLDVADAKARETIQMQNSGTTPTYNNSVSYSAKTTTGFPAVNRGSTGVCRPMKPADVLGTSLDIGGRGGACCGSCTAGGACDSKGGPGLVRSNTCGNGRQMITASFSGNGSNNQPRHGTRPW